MWIKISHNSLMAWKWGLLVARNCWNLEIFGTFQISFLATIFFKETPFFHLVTFPLSYFLLVFDFEKLFFMLIFQLQFFLQMHIFLTCFLTYNFLPQNFGYYFSIFSLLCILFFTYFSNIIFNLGWQWGLDERSGFLGP